MASDPTSKQARRRKPALILELGESPPTSARLRIARPLELLEDNPRGDLWGVLSVEHHLGATGNDYYVDVRFHGSAVQLVYPNGQEGN